LSAFAAERRAGFKFLHGLAITWIDGADSIRLTPSRFSPTRPHVPAAFQQMLSIFPGAAQGLVSIDADGEIDSDEP
jgi:hypothetical protein